jgi:hypothetical protein
MIYNILNGDGLATNFNLDGNKVVCRECLIEGDLSARSLENFWEVRANFIGKNSGDNSYFEKVKGEFDKLNHLQPDDEVNLWFGNEAFCQVNMWFILWLFYDKDATFYRVFPDSNDWNCSFEDLPKCLESRRQLTKEDVHFGRQLWKAFCFNESWSLEFLGKTDSPVFKNLDKVCRALIEIETRPKKVLREIYETGEKDFDKIFLLFREKAGIYGFGDTQVKNLINSGRRI